MDERAVTAAYPRRRAARREGAIASAVVPIGIGHLPGASREVDRGDPVAAAHTDGRRRGAPAIPVGLPPIAMAGPGAIGREIDGRNRGRLEVCDQGGELPEVMIGEMGSNPDATAGPGVEGRKRDGGDAPVLVVGDERGRTLGETGNRAPVVVRRGSGDRPGWRGVTGA